MTVSTVMQLQKHQPGSRRFTILVSDSQGLQHIAVMTGQMLAGEVGLQLRITYGGKQLRHRAPKLPVRQKEIRHLKNKVRDAFLSQIVGAERLGNLPSDAPHLHFQLLLLHIPARNAEGGTIAEAVILAENHPRIRHAQNACGTGHIIENIVFLELIRRDYHVYIGKFKETEIDFVAEKPNDKLYIQVTESMLSPETRERELRPLQMIPDNYEKIVLSMDRNYITSYDGIKSLNLIDWLLA